MTHDDISDAEIEAVARAKARFVVLRNLRVLREERDEAFIERAVGHAWPDYITESRAAILASRAALLAEGRKVVAREGLTEEMIQAALAINAWKADGTARGMEKIRKKYQERWRVMWDAAP